MSALKYQPARCHSLLRNHISHADVALRIAKYQQPIVLPAGCDALLEVIHVVHGCPFFASPLQHLAIATAENQVLCVGEGYGSDS
jgi:hypothetical protein